VNDDLRIRFLIVDAEPTIRKLCLRIGQSLGFVCLEAESAEAALLLLRTDAPDLVITDLRLPQKSGVELLEWIKSARPHIEVAIMTGHGSIDSALEAMKLGAYHYITKPFAVEEMRLILQRMADKVCLRAERDRLRDQVLELETRLARAGVRSSDHFLDTVAIPTILRPANAPAASDVAPSQAPTDLEYVERITIQRVYELVHGDKMLAGKMLGISRATLYRKLKRYNIGTGAAAAASRDS
jgi:DNA-binding NtrC family response regulator